MNYRIIDSFSITRVIRDYPKIENEIREIEDDIINGKSKNQSRGSSYGNPTMYKALAICDNERINTLRREQKAVDAALDFIHAHDDFPDEAMKFIHAFYWSNRYNFYGALENVGIKKRRGAAISRHMRYIVALNLGKVKFKKLT
jgi:hypothetical protein